jgi:hypothetical protein
MRITEIKYQRVKNLGNYETERVEMVAIVDENDDPKFVFEWLKMIVEQNLGLIE